jgi:hypothetical protein
VARKSGEEKRKGRNLRREERGGRDKPRRSWETEFSTDYNLPRNLFPRFILVCELSRVIVIALRISLYVYYSFFMLRLNFIIVARVRAHLLVPHSIMIYILYYCACSMNRTHNSKQEMKERFQRWAFLKRELHQCARPFSIGTEHPPLRACAHVRSAYPFAYYSRASLRTHLNALRRTFDLYTAIANIIARHKRKWDCRRKRRGWDLHMLHPPARNVHTETKVQDAEEGCVLMRASAGLGLQCYPASLLPHKLTLLLLYSMLEKMNPPCQ